MFRSFRQKSRRRVSWGKKVRAALRITPLEARLSPAVTASFIAATGQLIIFGDELDNTIVASRNAAGTILVNGGAVAVQGGTPTVANTVEIRIFGQRGNDHLTLDEANGALPRLDAVRRRRQ